jgi:integrase
VFISVRTKDKLTPRAIGFILKKYAERAGLDIHPHDLRHRLAIAWRSQRHFIALLKSWDMILWTPP